MKTLFRSQGLWKVVEQGVLTVGTEAQKEESQKDDAQALYLIQQAVDASIFNRITSTTASAKDAYVGADSEAVPRSFNSHVISMRRQTLKQRFEVLQMKEAENIQEYITRGHHNC